MPGVGAYLEGVLLNYSLNTGSVTRPTNWAVGLSQGAPSSISGSEVGTGSGWTRQTCPFPAAASPIGSCSNSAAMTFGTGLTAATFSGLQIWDTMAPTAGNMLYYGTLATPRTLGVGDSLVLPIGALVITLS
jgi:hypothetical protein